MYNLGGITNEVARQLNNALPNLLTQLVEALGEGVVGLLTWFESMEYVLHISLFPAESQVELASSAIAQPWEDFKKLLMKEYCPDDEIQKLELEFWNHKMVGSDIDGYTTRFHELARLVPHMVSPKSQYVNRYIRGLAPDIKVNVTSYKTSTIHGAGRMAIRLTTDGIKYGILKKKENTRDKKRSNDQHNNRGRNDRSKIQRTGMNFSFTAPKQGQVQCQYADQHQKCAKCNFHHSGNIGTKSVIGHFKNM
ncbi:putative reverse transcriptase domain-containing protein [Tanacetum coccineum]